MNVVTLIIPTFNRPLLLKRILTYYKNLKINFKIIIADSSSLANKEINQEIINSFPGLNLLYIDKYSEKLVSHHKFADMVNYVKSKYVCFCADDDFIVPNGIKEAVKFLDKNPDYVSAHGTYIYFYPHTTITGKKVFWWNYIYPYKSISYSNPVDRLIAHPIDCQQVLYSVRRTDIVKKIYRELLVSKVDPHLFGERLPDVLTLIYGKMKRLDNFYGAREAFSTSYSYWPSERDAIKQGSFNREYAKFKQSIIKNILPISDISKEEAGKIVDKNMQAYISSSFQQHLLTKLNLALRYLPKLVSKGVRVLHAKYLFSKEKKDRIGLINQPSSKYFHEFDTIRKHVLS